MAPMTLPKLSNVFICLAITGLLATPPSEAQEVLSSGDVSGGQKVDMDMSFLKSAKIKDGAGKVQESSVDTTWSWSFLSLEYEGKTYRWESPNGNPFSPAREPAWNTLNTIWLSAGYSNSISKQLHYTVEADSFVSFEQDYTGLTGNDADGTLSYSFSDGWAAYGGLAVHRSPFKTEVSPLFGVVHGVETDSGWNIRLGIPETKIGYRFNSCYSVDAGLSVFNVDYYRLSVDNSRSNDRYLETSDNRLFLVFNMALSKNLSVGAGIQYAVDNEFRFYNENNQNDSTYHLSSVPGIILNLQYSF